MKSFVLVLYTDITMPSFHAVCSRTKQGQWRQ